MYNDYSINEWLFHWQSQSTTAAESPTGQRYIHHVERGSQVLLFVREFKADWITGGAEAYTFMGTADYVKHKELILRELPLTADELKAELADRQRVKAPLADSDEESEDDGIVSFEIPPAEIVQRLQRIDRIHEICHRYIFAYHESVTGSNSATRFHNSGSGGRSKAVVHQATNYEIAFQKFVKRRIRDLTYAPFSSAVSYSKYLSYCMVFEDIFKK